ncbi:MAG: FtsX-like permease family protein [Deinococcales bacterium]
MNHLVIFLAFKHIRRRPLQSSLTVLGVAVGVIVLVVVLSLFNGFSDELLKKTLQATPHVSLNFGNYNLLQFDEAVLNALQGEPGVVAASPYLSTQALIARRANRDQGVSGRRSYVELVGIDPKLAQDIFSLPALRYAYEALLVDDREQAGDSETALAAIVLGRGLAYRLGVFPGDEVFIVDIDGRRRSYKVAADFSVNNALIDDNLAFVSLISLQDYLRAENEISGYQLRIAQPEEASWVAARLGSKYGLLASSWQDLYGIVLEQLALQKVLSAIVIFLIIIVAAVGIANVLVLMVTEKREEIGILRALGSSQKAIMQLFTLESLILGGGGMLLGLLVGFGLCLYFSYYPVPIPGTVYIITHLRPKMQFWDFALSAIFALVTSIIFGLLPARRASRVNPAEILR